MKTETLFAYQVENNDFLVIDGRSVGYVYSIDEDNGDKGDFILFNIVDDEAEHTQYPFGAFDSVTIVASFLDDESVDGAFIEVEL